MTEQMSANYSTTMARLERDYRQAWDALEPPAPKVPKSIIETHQNTRLRRAQMMEAIAAGHDTPAKLRDYGFTRGSVNGDIPAMLCDGQIARVCKGRYRIAEATE